MTTVAFGHVVAVHGIILPFTFRDVRRFISIKPLFVSHLYSAEFLVAEKFLNVALCTLITSRENSSGSTLDTVARFLVLILSTVSMPDVSLSLWTLCASWSSLISCSVVQ